MTTPHRQDVALKADVIRHAPATITDLDVVHVASGYERWVKPVIDRTAALLLILLLAPVLIAVAIGVRMTLGEGVLYRQSRVGKDGVPFQMLKFRSMAHDRRADRGDGNVIEDRRRTHKHPADPRVNDFGRFIRRWSLDELPQFFNVLKGDLSLVGPRPELTHIVERYEPWEHHRHAVKPGLTGLWQVTARDDGGLMHLCVGTDLEYVRGLSPMLDLRILAMTPMAIATGAGPARA